MAGNLSTGTATDGWGGTDTLSTIENVTGSAYNDTLTGSTSANVIHGGAGDDTINGKTGNDTLYGDAGNDNIDGGGGADDVYGGSGADVFLFKAATAFSTPIIVHDFSTSEHDTLDVHDLLTGYDPVTSAITDFIHVTASGSDAIVSVDANGTTGGSSYTQIATLTGQSALAAHEADMLAAGQLIAHV